MASDASGRKMVPESDLLRFKKENQQLKSKLTRLEKRLEVVDLSDVTDEDAKSVKQMLLDREAELDELEQKLKDQEAELEARESSIAERAKEDSVKALIEKYGPKDEEAKSKFKKAISDADDPEKEALRLFVERDKKETPEEENPAENVYETTPSGGKVKKAIPDMTPEEFAAYEADLIAKSQKT